jgi:hypothetical protein
MKNIHVLPTDKPSRIYLIKSNNKLGITSNNPEFTENFGSGTQNQHIYITNDEEIKVGDFFYSVRGVIEKAIINYPKGEHFGKLILTTDQNLIKYGVQAIDDEFLEWFVKNPSCEGVEVIYEPKNYINTKKGWEYLIIIPKEQQKQHLIDIMESDEELGLYDEPNSKEIKLEDVFNEEKKKGVKELIDKHKQERSYSEGDLREAYFSAIKSTGEGWNGEYANGNNPNIEEKFTEGFEEWFEQFKNK